MTNPPATMREIQRAEHDSSANVAVKKVGQYGWDSSAMEWVRLAVNSSGEIIASLEASDIQIGAVEIKDGTTDTRAVVTGANALKVDGSAVTQPVSATNLDIRDLVFATDKVDASGTTLGANSGVDIGDVTVNNGAGASAVNIQDGGNSITVDGPLTDTQLRATPVPVSMSSDIEIGAVEIKDGTSDNRAVVTASGEVVTASIGTVSTNNSSTTPLGGGGVFTGTADDIRDHAAITVNVFSSHDSASNGLSLQWSSDGTNWDITETYDVSASDGRSIQASPRARYFRIVYTNGATPQTTFRLQTILRPITVQDKKGPINETLRLDDPAELVRAVITGETTGGGGGFVNVKVSPSGAVQVGGDINIDKWGNTSTTLGQKAMTASVPVVLASDQSAVTVQATNLDIRDLVFATDKVDASGTALGANSGVDIGDVTINNAAGAAAVNIQDGGNSITVDGSITANPSRPATGTATQVADTAADTTILASNASRLGATVYNDSSALLYLLCASGTSSSTNYTARVYSNGYFEVPAGYTGVIKGIWASDPNDGGAKVTEFT